jgi:hypothetical protein
MLHLGRAFLLALTLLILPAASVSAQAQRAQDCAAFVGDVTMPDGTPVLPGQAFDKVWLLRNCGSNTWTDFRALPAEDGFGTEALPVTPTEPGRPVYIYAPLVAPEEPGCHRATYQLAGPRGLTHSLFFAEVLVLGPETRIEQTMKLADLLPSVPAPEDLGEHWTRWHSEVFERKGCARGPGYSAFYSNTTDYPLTNRSPRGRIVIIGAQVEADADAAEARIQDTLARDGSTPIEELGDGSAVRQAKAGFTSYQFRVGAVGAGLSVTSDGVDEGELEEQGLALARLMIDRLRPVLEGEPSAPDPDVFRTGPPPLLPDLRPLALPLSALQGTWSVLDVDDIGRRYRVEYLNAAEAKTAVAGRTRMVEVTVALAASPEQAAAGVDQALEDLEGTTVNGQNVYRAVPWEDHPGGYQIERTEDSVVDYVSYVFHVGRYMAQVEVHNAPGTQPDLRVEALRLAQVQERQLEVATSDSM